MTVQIGWRGTTVDVLGNLRLLVKRLRILFLQQTIWMTLHYSILPGKSLY